MLVLTHLCNILRRDSDRGASYVEYAFLVALIAIVCLVAVQFFGQGVSTNFSKNASYIHHS